MNELIQISSAIVGGNESETVNARDLHVFIESSQDFSTWIRKRVKQYGFEEGKDYLLHKIVEQVPHQGGARTSGRTEYIITLDMAKELAMVERNVKGKAVREYFIACERKVQDDLRLQNQQMQAMLPDMERMAELERRVATLTSPFLKHNTPNALHKFADNRAEAAAAAERAKVKAKNEADVARHKRDKTKDNLRLALICAADYRDLLEKVLGAKVIPTTAGNEFLRLQMAHTALTNAHIGLRPVDDYGFRRINEDVLARMARYMQAEDDAVFVS